MRVMKFAFLAACCATQTCGLLLQGTSDKRSRTASAIPHFDDFLQKFGRSYAAGSAEYNLRRVAYEDRIAAADSQNSKTNRLWTAGVNFLWDWTEDEFARLRNWRHGARPTGNEGSGGKVGLVQLSDLPKAKSWAHLVAQRHIHNQGACGSCWAIAASTVIQAHAQIHAQITRTFSAQQLVSCVQNPDHCGGDGGCRGATVELAYAWVMKHGLAEDYEVPYAGVDGTCGVGPPAQGLLSAAGRSGGEATSIGVQGGAASFGMKSWSRLPENRYEPVLQALAEKGPIAVSVSAGPWSIYENGIFDACFADAIIDHAVVLIGYGAEEAVNGTKFWLVQNSWGVGWGESGKIRLLRHDDEGSFCGVNTDPQKGTGCNGGPANVTVCGTCGILYDNVIPHF